MTLPLVALHMSLELAEIRELFMLELRYIQRIICKHGNGRASNRYKLALASIFAKRIVGDVNCSCFITIAMNTCSLLTGQCLADEAASVFVRPAHTGRAGMNYH